MENTLTFFAEKKNVNSFCIHILQHKYQYIYKYLKYIS